MKGKFTLLAALGVASVSASALAAEPAKPNFLQILTDDQGWGDLGCYGHQYMKTPNIDKLAKEGIKLTYCYSSHAVSSPSRSSILTGRTPYRNGVFTWIPAHSEIYLHEDEKVLAQLMRDNGGYQTAHFGKWHLSHYSEKKIGKFGFDYDSFGFSDEPKQPTMKDYGYDYYLATGNVARPDHHDPENFFLNGEALGRVRGFSADIVAKEFVKWMTTVRDKNKPFFITVWFHEPHGPIMSDPQLMKQYEKVPDKSLRQFWANVSQVDRAVGDIVAALKDAGLYDDTMIWYTSDNGPEGSDGFGGFGVDESHGKFRYRGETGGLKGRKRSNNEGGIRVPGIISWPAGLKAYGVAPGHIRSEGVIGCDVFPTMLEAAGIARPKGVTLDGSSIMPIFKGKAFERDQPLYWRNEKMIAMRDGDWKIVGSPLRKNFILHNIVMDPRETSDFSKFYPKEFERLKKMIIAYDKEVVNEGRERVLPFPKGGDIIKQLD